MSFFSAEYQPVIAPVVIEKSRIWLDEMLGNGEKENLSILETMPETAGEQKPQEQPAVKNADMVDGTFPEEMPVPSDFQITDMDLGHGGQKAKYRNNIAAIKTLQVIEQESRSATKAEQEILSRYVGWGGLPQAFDEKNASWQKEHQELRGLLSPEEYKSARESTLNAHYTSPMVIEAIYAALANMGVAKGNALEAGCGTGNFIGMRPDGMKDVKFYGVEKDSLTGRIAQKLYPHADIRIEGFEKTQYPDNFFDCAVGNVPFGGFKLNDKRYDKHNFLIHDYFIAKELDKVRPGGVLALITSKGTMDKANPTVRKYIAQRAELVGTIRLPNNAFQDNAGTHVTSDILFLKKRERPVTAEPEWVHLGKTAAGLPVNQYFLDNPQMLLGTMEYEARMYGNEKDTTCQPFPDADLQEQLKEAISHIHGDYQEAAVDIENPDKATLPADPNVRNFSYTEVEGNLYFRQDSIMTPVEMGDIPKQRILGMMGIRDCVRRLIDLQLYDHDDAEIQAKQAELNGLYEDYAKKYSRLCTRGNSMAFSEDAAYPLLLSLEVNNDEGDFDRKSDIFTKRTIRNYRVPEHVETAQEALILSLSEKGRIDMEYMEALTGKELDTLLGDLRGVVFTDIRENGVSYETADAFLTGNVKEKLQRYQAMKSELGEADDRTTEIINWNIQKLTEVQPEPLTATDIFARLGAPWIPPDVIEAFMYELLQTPLYLHNRITVSYSEISGSWNVAGKSADIRNILANMTYGTQRSNAYRLIDDALNQRDTRIFDYVEEDGKRKAVLNRKETELAQQKQEAIKDAFKEWIWKDPARRNRLVDIYNDKFNTTRMREYDGSHLKFHSMNPEIALNTHQRNAIARSIYGGNALFAHCVGAGKSFEMIASIMEKKWLGLTSKAVMVVPNHLTGDIASEFMRLYPSANILVATEKDFSTKNRRKFCSRIATGDYDCVVMGHSQFEKIPISAERQAAQLEQQVEDILDAIAELKEKNGERYQIKEFERAKKSLEARLQSLYNSDKKDNVITFEELGIDMLVVDEADTFKNLFVYSHMRNVAGISQTEAQKSSDMFMKCRYIDEVTNGKGIIFATGTPISNSMTELFTMQRYLQYAALEKSGLKHFDAWAATFGEVVTAIELAPEGTGYRAKTRFAKFHNIPELMKMFREVADIQTSDMLNLPVPKANYKTIAVKPSEEQKAMVEALGERAKLIRDKRVEPTEDNMLRVTNEGRKLALDQRMMNELLPDDPGSKVNACVENVFKIWDAHREEKLTQILFCDLSTPKATGFNIYADVKEKLVRRGVPEEEIAFIHSAKNDRQKQELYAKVRQGKVRVLMGSTQKLGAGTNVQNLLIAGHDLDCPWRPRDLEQRAGRTIRQGNKNKEVEMFRYVTEGTFDSYLFQIVEQKQRFISQIMTSKTPVRSAEDVDEATLSYAEIKALASGNPLIKEKMDLDVQVAKLRMAKANHDNQRYMLEDRISTELPKEISGVKESVKNLQAAKSNYARQIEKAFGKNGFAGMSINGKTFDERKDAGEALLNEIKKDVHAKKQIGTYMGFALRVEYDPFYQVYSANLSDGHIHLITRLSTDAVGNIQRIANTVESIPERLSDCENTLANLERQLAIAKEQVGIPFAKAEELKEKTARLNELNILLNMDERSDGEAKNPAAQQQGKKESMADKLNRASAKAEHRNIAGAGNAAPGRGVEL